MLGVTISDRIQAKRGSNPVLQLILVQMEFMRHIGVGDSLESIGLI
jgi:hypothetical protein